MPQPQNATRPQSTSNATEALPKVADAETQTTSEKVSNAKARAARVSLEINSAIAEQVGKAFDEEASELEKVFAKDSEAVERLIDSVTREFAIAIGAAANSLREQLPALVALQADRMREMARAVRGSEE